MTPRPPARAAWAAAACCAPFPRVGFVRGCRAAGARRGQEQLTCVFVDHGLLRKDEGDEVEAAFGPHGPYDLNFIRVNAQQRFYGRLAGVEEPEQQAEDHRRRMYPRVRGSGQAHRRGGLPCAGHRSTRMRWRSGLGGESAVIKSHHNVGGLPDCVDFKEIIEPLRDLFKDEVRQAGRELGISGAARLAPAVPRPGLAIRIMGSDAGKGEDGAAGGRHLP